MKTAQVEQDLLERGIIDNNKLYTYALNDTFGSGFVGGAALAKAGMSSTCLFCVKNGVFSMYKAKMNKEIEQLEFSCNLSDMKDVKFVTTPPGLSVLKFTVNDQTYKLKGFKNGKIFLPSFRDANLVK